MWRVPRSLNIGHTSRIVEMIDLFPTLIELVSAMSITSAAHPWCFELVRAGAQAGLPALPKCKRDSLPPLACLDGESFASAFGVGTAQPRTAAIHQWPYSTYTAVRVT